VSSQSLGLLGGGYLNRTCFDSSSNDSFLYCCESGLACRVGGIWPKDEGPRPTERSQAAQDGEGTARVVRCKAS